MKYKIQILDDEKFDSLPYPETETSLGIADPETNKAYVRYTGLKEVDNYLVNHELEHLIEKRGGRHSNHYRHGVYYKGEIAAPVGRFSAATPQFGLAARAAAPSGIGLRAPTGFATGLASLGTNFPQFRAPQMQFPNVSFASQPPFPTIPQMNMPQFAGSPRSTSLSQFGSTPATRFSPQNLKGSLTQPQINPLSSFQSGGQPFQPTPPPASFSQAQGASLQYPKFQAGGQNYTATAPPINAIPQSTNTPFYPAGTGQPAIPPTGGQGGGFGLSGVTATNVNTGKTMPLSQVPGNMLDDTLGGLQGKFGNLDELFKKVVGSVIEEKLGAVGGLIKQGLDLYWGMKGNQGGQGPGGGMLLPIQDLPSVQALSSMRVTNFQELDPQLEQAILSDLRRTEEEELGRLRDTYHSLKPGADMESDSSFRRDMFELQRMQGERRSDMLSRAKFDFYKLNLAASDQEMRRLIALSYLEVGQIMAQMNMDAAQAESFQSSFQSMGKLAGYQGPYGTMAMGQAAMQNPQAYGIGP